MKRRQMLLSAASMLSASAVHAQTPRLRRVAIAIPNAPDSSNEGIKAFNIGRNPMGRYGQAEEVACLVVFLASDSASYVNGAAWLIDGGRTAV